MKVNLKSGDYYILREEKEWPNIFRNTPFMSIFPGLSLERVQEFGILVVDSFNKEVNDTEELFFKIIQAEGNSYKEFEFPKKLICDFFIKKE